MPHGRVKRLSGKWVVANLERVTAITEVAGKPNTQAEKGFKTASCMLQVGRSAAASAIASEASSSSYCTRGYAG